MPEPRPVALVTGASRSVGIGAAVARTLAAAATAGRRVGSPDDAARLVGFLCSADGGWVNGQLIRSDGGFAR